MRKGRYVVLTAGVKEEQTIDMMQIGEYLQCMKKVLRIIINKLTMDYKLGHIHLVRGKNIWDNEVK